MTKTPKGGTVTRTEHGRQLRAKNHTACPSDRRCRTDFNSRICGDLFLHLHSAPANILLPICLVRVQSNRYHPSHYCAKHESGGYSDLGDTKRCVCIGCLSVAQMRLLKPCTDLAHVAQDRNVRTALCTATSPLCGCRMQWF